MPNTVSKAVDFKEGLLAAKYTRTLFRFSTSEIIIRASVNDNAFASATAPCSLATYFGPVIPYVYIFIAEVWDGSTTIA